MLPHGHILLTPETREALTSCQMVVVAVGAPILCDDPDCERPHATEDSLRMGRHRVPCQPQDWVLVRHRSLTETHEEGLYACQQDDVLAVLQP